MSENIEVLSLSAAEKVAVVRALTAAKWNKAKAAGLLDMSRSTLYRKIRAHQIVRPPEGAP